MKKVLAIVLAMAMMLSFVPLMVSAMEISEGQMCFGVKNDIEANPGETAVFDLEFKCLPFPEDIENITENGTVYVAYAIYPGDVDMGPLAGVELTDEAKAAGIENIFTEDYDLNAEDVISGFIKMPSKYFFNGEAITILKLKVNVSPEWEVIDYVATYPLAVNVYAGDDAGYPVFYVDENSEPVENPYEYAAENYVYGVYGVSGNITAKPYQPKFFERVWEWIKSKIRFLIDLDNIIDNLLYTKVFNPADWYDDYMLRKQAK